MTKSEVLERLCLLCSEVGSSVYHDAEPHDCFCHLSHAGHGYRMDEAVIKFIEEAVKDKITSSAGQI